MTWPFIRNHHVNTKHTPAVILPDPASNHIDPILSRTVDKLKVFIDGYNR